MARAYLGCFYQFVLTVLKRYVLIQGMNIVEEVIDWYGGVKKVQERFEYTEPMAVYNWRRRGLPQDKIADIYIDTGIPLERLKEKPNP